jgi:hypothetical protein
MSRMTDPNVPRSFPSRLHKVRTFFPLSCSNGPTRLSGRRITYQKRDVPWVPKLESSHCLGSFSNRSAIVDLLPLSAYFDVLSCFLQHRHLPAEGRSLILRTELG